MTLAILAAMAILVIAFIVVMERGQRRITVQYAKRVQGRRMFDGNANYLPLRINSAGVMPIIFAQAIIIVPGTLYSFTGGQGASGFLYDLSQIFQPGSMWYYVTYAALIIVFTYVYTAIIFNPVDLAENLKKQGGFIPGVKPGAQTAEYIDQVLTRVTLPGSVYLAVIALLPFWIFDAFDIQTFFFGGTSLLIVVGVALDTVQQMQQHLLLRQYEGFMKKGRVKYRGRQRYM
jgi:preprotein translocase subunit SecY